LQQEMQLLNNTINQSLNSLSQVVTTCTAHFASNNALSAYDISSSSPANVGWWDSLHRTLNDGFTSWQHLA